MTTQEELTQLTGLIKSATFHILPESAQQPTLAKQRELAIKLVNERIQLYINPLIKEYGLEDVFNFQSKEVSKGEFVEQSLAENNKDKEAPSDFKVVFPDGTEIHEDVAVETFISALRKIGLERIAGMDNQKKFAGFDLVGKKERLGVSVKRQTLVDGWWIYTSMNNESKASTLYHINNELMLGLTIFINEQEYVPSNNSNSFGIRVQFPDGEVIHEPQAKYTFVNTLVKIGLERIYRGNHGVEHSGCKIVDRIRKESSAGHGDDQCEVDGYFIYTHLNNRNKVEDLKKLNDYFKLNLLIEMDSEDGFVVMQKPKATYDKTTYSLNGGEFLNKRRFALALVRQYVDDNPDATYEDLKEVFVPEIISGRGVLRSIMDLDDLKQEEIPKRYMMADEDLITLKSDDIITVCSQWNLERIEKMVNIAEALGYTVESQAKD